MDAIRTTIKWTFAFAYFDDTMVFSNPPAEALFHGHQVLCLLSATYVMFKLKTWSFFTDPMGSFVHRIRSGRLKMVMQTSEAIHGLRELRKVT